MENPRSTTDFIQYTQTARECRQTFILKFNLSHKLQLLNVQHSFCSVMCYIVLVWTVILLTLWNNIVTLLFNRPKPVHYVPTDKIDASIHIRIQHILKVIILIRRMQISASFITSLDITHQYVVYTSVCCWVVSTCMIFAVFYVLLLLLACV